MSDTQKPHDAEGAPACCGGHDHAPPARERSVLNPEAGNLETTLQITGMDCADEVEALEQALRPLKGVREVRVNLMGRKVTILHDESTTAEQLIAAIAPTGMKASRADAQHEAGMEGAKRLQQISVAVSGAFTGLGLLAQWMKFGPALVANIAFGVAIVAGGWFIAPKAWRAVRRLALDMNVLMTVAVAGAMAIGEFSEGAAVAFLFALAELLEAFSLARARKAVQALMQLTPETALLKDGAEFREVPVEQVAVGATIAVRSGSRVPLDGVVTVGESAINQAPITGESMPVEKEPGDTVFAGTINGAGSLELQTTRAHTDTTIAKIIHLVEEAQSQKAPSQRFVDVFARYYTPSVMVAALLVMLVPPLLFGGAWLSWFYRGLVLLVIACPCALVISTPVSVVSGLTALARRGVLIKGGAVLEAIGKLRALAVDKTGTITEGKPRVTKVIAMNSTGETGIIRIAAGIDTHSEHPLALAVWPTPGRRR
jgi:Cd2+/Zn2+-exporting ATPase